MAQVENLIHFKNSTVSILCILWDTSSRLSIHPWSDIYLIVQYRIKSSSKKSVVDLSEQLDNVKNQISSNVNLSLDRLKQECAEEVRRLESKNDDLERNLKDMKTEIDLLQKEIDEQKEANVRAPTATMKKFVETLKSDLAVKENKLKVWNLKELQWIIRWEKFSDELCNSNKMSYL